MARLVGLLMLSLLSACSPAAVLNALAPRAGISVTRDVAYAGGERRTLDIYAPAGQFGGHQDGGAAAEHSAPPPLEGGGWGEGSVEGGLWRRSFSWQGPLPPTPSLKGRGRAFGRPAPVIVLLYGGSWQSGSKATYRFVGAALAARGFVTVIPDYRVYPEVSFPGFIQDAAAAVGWTRSHIAAYGGDGRRIVLMGHSAGAQIAALLTLDRRWLAAVGLDADRDIAAMVGLAGPYDFLPLKDPVLQALFAPAGDLRQTQPITFARGDAPPLFLAAGTADTTVLPRNTERLAAAIQAAGGRVETRLYPGVGHAEIIGAVAGPLRWLAPVLNDVTGFLRGVSPSLSTREAAANRSPSPRGRGLGGGGSARRSSDAAGSLRPPPPPNLGPLRGPSPQGEGESMALAPTSW